MVAKCHLPEATSQDPQRGLFTADGELQLKAHQVGWIVSAIFTILSLIITVWHVNKHLMFFTSPRHQRYIVRILFMCPFYSVLSFVSYFFWKEALYFELIRDSYEAFVLVSFFYLILEYIGSNTVELAMAFKACTFEKWMWPLGSVKRIPKPWTLLQICKIGVLQYAILRPLTTLLAIILEYIGLYCLTSWSPLYYHLWDVIIVSISVSVAMYCLLQIMVAMKQDLTYAKPVLKFFAVKALIFIIFWQATLVAVLGSYGLGIKATKYWTLQEVEAGIEAILITAEMVIFALFQVKAFTYIVYRPEGASSTERKDLRTNRWQAFLKVLDIRDMGREVAASSIYVTRKVGGRSTKDGRSKHMEAAFGRVRAEKDDHSSEKEKVDEEGGEQDFELDLQRLKAQEPRDRLVSRDSLDDLQPLLKQSKPIVSWAINNSYRVTHPRQEETMYSPSPGVSGWTNYGTEGAASCPASASRHVVEGLGITRADVTNQEEADRTDRAARRHGVAFNTIPRITPPAWTPPDIIAPPLDFDPHHFAATMLGIGSRFDDQSSSASSTKKHAIAETQQIGCSPLAVHTHRYDAMEQYPRTGQQRSATSSSSLRDTVHKAGCTAHHGDSTGRTAAGNRFVFDEV